MKSKIEIDPSSQTPVYKQLIQSVQYLVETGEYKQGEFLPSPKELGNELDISNETVKKAYSILREKGIIDAYPGKGFFISENEQKKTRILLAFDKISTYKQVLYSSFIANIGDSSEITIRLHNQDIDLFEQFIEENLGKYDYYLVTPHFPLQPDIQKRVIKTLNTIPRGKLIILDRHLDGLSGNYGSIYQDFENDIFSGLTESIELIRKFKKLNVISLEGSCLYAPVLEKGIVRFCDKNQINYVIHKNITPEIIQKDEAYLVLVSQLDTDLIELVRIAKTKDCNIGEDIGIISYNESPVNEIILNGLTVLSTDFIQMGELAAKMIRENNLQKIKCDFQLIKRNTF